MRNPFARRRRDPVEQVLDAAEDVRAEAAKRAAAIRDAAADAVELLGEAAPEARRHRIPLVLGVLAAGVGTAIALRSRRGGPSEPATAEAPLEPAATTAARATAVSEPEASKPAAEVEPERPKEPKAATEESEAAAGEAGQ